MGTELAVIPAEYPAIARSPEEVLADARRAALALKAVIDGKSKPVKFNGETYLEFEDWQTVARFYGMTVKVRDTRYVAYGDVTGFEAFAEVLSATGQVVSGAESMCLGDEKNWSARPLFQLRSMAQTRACAKALRNVLAWVVVLGGYRPTPAEEMDDVPQQRHVPTVQRKSAAVPAPEAEVGNGKRFISEAQRKRMYAIYKQTGWQDSEVKALLKTKYGLEHSNEITTDIYEDICTVLEAGGGV